MSVKQIILFLSVVAALLLFGPMAVPVRTQSHLQAASDVASAQAEIQLGRQVAAAVERDYKMVHNRSVAGYVQDLGERLGALSGRSDVSYHVQVIDTPQIGAFALPSGHVYINQGTIELCQFENQLAAVLAHEISHVVKRHNLDRLQQAIESKTGRLKDNVSPDIFSSYSVDAEREVDRLAVSLMRRSGFNPTGMVAFIDRIKALESKDRRATPGTCFAPDSNMADRRRIIATLLVASDSDLASDSRRFREERWRLSVSSLFPAG